MVSVREVSPIPGIRSWNLLLYTKWNSNSPPYTIWNNAALSWKNEYYVGLNGYLRGRRQKCCKTKTIQRSVCLRHNTPNWISCAKRWIREYAIAFWRGVCQSQPPPSTIDCAESQAQRLKREAATRYLQKTCLGLRLWTFYFRVRA